MARSPIRILRLSLMLLVAAPTAAPAVDGVREINQTCATKTGCFSGDPVGFPVRIDGTAGRSYRLTSDLVVPTTPSVHGIFIDGLGISVDLNGFEIISDVCVGAISSSCRPASGSGSGIDANLGPTDSHLGGGLSVRNGSVTGMASHGVRLGAQAEVVGLRVRWNRLDGVNTRDGSTIARNTVLQNGDDGISAGEGSTIAENTVSQNGGNGIVALEGANVTGNSVFRNSRTGIQIGNGAAFEGSATVSGNSAILNGFNGISALAGSTVSGNTASANGNAGLIASTGSTVSGNTASENGNSGIVTAGDCLVQGNTVRGNVAFGLSITPDTAYRENNINDNVGGTVLNGGVNLGANSCNGTAVCP